MPIETLGDGTPLIVLGHGDVAMGQCRTEEGPAPAFSFMHSDSLVPIGGRDHGMSGASTTQHEAIAIWVDDIESLQVLIEGLMSLKLWMMERGATKKYGDAE